MTRPSDVGRSALAVLAALLAGCGGAPGFLGDARGDGWIADGRERRPLRIGKVIKKRQIPPVTPVAQADWLTRPEREAEEQPGRVVEALNISKGATVVDLGAGVGYFTWRLAEQVGESGRVIAVDVQQGMLDRLRQNLQDRNITNVEVVLGEPGDPHLPVGQVDLVLLVDVYHELAQPEDIMEQVRRSLKPGGRVVVIEYRKEDPNIPLPPVRKMTAAEVRSELEPVGFRFVGSMDFVPTQHILIFKDAASRGS